MRELLKLMELADKYNFEITIKPSCNIWNIEIRRFFEVNGVKDFYARHMVFHKEDIEDLNVSFETVLAEVDKDFSIEMEEIKKEAEEERKKFDERIKSLYELSNELSNGKRE